MKGNVCWGLCVSVTVVNRKVGHPAEYTTGSRDAVENKDSYLFNIQHWRWNTDAPKTESQPLHALKSRLLCLRWECVGLRTWDQIKTSKNIAWIVLLLLCGRSHVLAGRTLSVLSAASTLSNALVLFLHCLGEVQDGGARRLAECVSVCKCCHDSFGKWCVWSHDLQLRERICGGSGSIRLN